jgi:DNA-binding protein HU-beta
MVRQAQHEREIHKRFVVAVRQLGGFNNHNLKGGSERMTKAELVSVMAGGASITKAAAALALETYVATIAKELKKNGKIGLVGFGTFSVVKRKAREGRNPQTGKTIKIPAKKVVKFKAGKALSEKAK